VAPRALPQQASLRAPRILTLRRRRAPRSERRVTPRSACRSSNGRCPTPYYLDPRQWISCRAREGLNGQERATAAIHALRCWWHEADIRSIRPILRTPGAIAQLGERLLCKQEVAGSIPAGSTRRIRTGKRDSTQSATYRCSRRASDGSVLEAFRSAGAHMGPVAQRRRATPAPLAYSHVGGAVGLTSRRTEAAARQEPKPNPRRRRSRSRPG
jgi:hypothetical protein